MKLKRILAMIGIILIVSMYVFALFAACSNHPDSKKWLMAAIFSTVFVPILIYVIQLVARLVRSEKEEP